MNMQKLLARIKPMKSALAIHLDMGSLINAGIEAEQHLHEAAGIAAVINREARAKKLELDVWIAGETRRIKEELQKKINADFRLWEKSENKGNRDMKPEPVRESEIKSALMANEEYSKRYKEYNALVFYHELVMSAYVEPLRQRLMFVMSIRKGL